MLNYILVGIVCFIIGFALGTLEDPYEKDEEEFDEDGYSDKLDCKDCFGASFGDCDHCPKNQD